MRLLSIFKLSFLAVVMLSVLLTTACSSIDCQLNGSVYCTYTLKNQYHEDMAFAVPLTITLCDTEKGDSIILNSATNVNSFDVPMSYNAYTDMIKLTLTVTDTITGTTEEGNDTTYYVTNPITDVIRISKTNEPYFESIDCAARYNHTIENVQSSNNFIDSLVINDVKVTNDASKENIYIFIHTAE